MADTTHSKDPEPELATKAPESDAQADKTETKPADASKPATSSIFPGDTPAQTGPTTGHLSEGVSTHPSAQASSAQVHEHCTSDRPLPPDAPAPKGEVSTIADVDAYVVKPASYPSAPAKLLLLLTNGAGVKSLNNQLQADAYAARGFLVVMPDQFGGDPAPKTHTITHEESAQPTLIERVKLGISDAAKSFQIDMWLARHTPESVLPRLRKVLDAAREEFADAVANGGGVYGAGYCFGAKYVLILAGVDKKPIAEGEAERAEEAELKVGAIAHGSLVTAEDIERVRAPMAMACVEQDQLFPDHVREQGKAALELNGVEHDVRVFAGVPHGFAVLGDYADANIKAKQEDAFEMMCGWLESH